MMVPSNDFTIYQGETVTLRWTLQPVTNIADWSIRFAMRDGLQKAAQIVDAPAGVFQVTLTAEETGALAVGAHYYDVARVDPGQEAVLAAGYLVVRESVAL
jgi:hypothetical protein